MTFCPECGTKNEDNAAFCGNCGSTLQQEAPTQPQQPPSQGYQQPQSGYQQPPQSGYQQPQSGYQQPMRPPGGSQSMAQYMMMRKGKGGPIFVSVCICAGLGMLMVDSNKYMGKFFGILIVSIVGIFLAGIPSIIAWIVGIVWTSQAVDEYNQNLSVQFGVAPY